MAKGVSRTVTGGHSKQDLRYKQKSLYLPFFTNKYIHISRFTLVHHYRRVCTYVCMYASSLWPSAVKACSTRYVSSLCYMLQNRLTPLRGGRQLFWRCWCCQASRFGSLLDAVDPSVWQSIEYTNWVHFVPFGHIVVFVSSLVGLDIQNYHTYIRHQLGYMFNLFALATYVPTFLVWRLTTLKRASPTFLYVIGLWHSLTYHWCRSILPEEMSWIP